MLRHSPTLRCRESAPSEMNLSVLSADWPSLSQVESIIVSWEASSRQKTRKTFGGGLQFNQHMLRENNTSSSGIIFLNWTETHYDVQVTLPTTHFPAYYFCGQNMGLQKCSHRNNESASIQKTKSAPCCSKFLSMERGFEMRNVHPTASSQGQGSAHVGSWTRWDRSSGRYSPPSRRRCSRAVHNSAGDSVALAPSCGWILHLSRGFLQTGVYIMEPFVSHY